MLDFQTANIDTKENEKVEKNFFQSETCFHAFHNDSYFKSSKDFVSQIPKNINQLIVVGMGGSFIATKAIYDAIRPNKKLLFWNSIDPDSIEENLNRIDQKTYILFVSKSGTTTETRYIYKKTLERFNKIELDPKKQIGVITEENNAFLHQEVIENKYNHTPHPKDIGGRFSVFSPVSFVPLLWAGVDVKKFIKSASQFDGHSKLQQNINAYYNQAIKYDVLIFWPYRDRLLTLSKWCAQLWAESLGKKEIKDIKIPIPLVCNSSLEQHSLLQHFMEARGKHCYMFLKDKASNLVNLQCDANFEAMTRAELPLAKLEFDKINEKGLAQFMASFLFSLFSLAEKYNIPPYGQEGVELSKKLLKEKNQALDEPYL